MKVIEKKVELSLDEILFATDFSASAEKAGLYVRAIARRYASKAWVMHVVDLSAAFQAPDAGVSIDCFRKSGEAGLAQAKAQFTSSGIATESLLCEATDPAEFILQIARDKSIDLIVTGTRGQKGLSRLAFGSTAEKLIHQAGCPVLTVGPEAKQPEFSGPFRFRSIVYATDFSPEAAKAAAYALSFARDSRARIYLCHVLPAASHQSRADSQELAERFAAALRRLVPEVDRQWCEPECIVEHGYAADGILLLAHRVKADLIVLGTRRFSHWVDPVKAGIAYEVIAAAICPVLTVCG